MKLLGLFAAWFSVQRFVKTSLGNKCARLPGFPLLNAISAMALLCLLGSNNAHAQTSDSTINIQRDSLVGGPIDTTTGGGVRPRRETFIIDAFPSPAPAGKSVTIQYYNHTPQVTMLRVVDFLDRPISTNPSPLQYKQLMQNGLHKFTLSTVGLSAGMYFIRLTTYTASGDIDIVQDSRFMILH